MGQNMSEKSNKEQKVEEKIDPISELEYVKSELTELQIEYTHQQDHITILDQVVLELRAEVESLKKHVQVLEEKLNTSQQEATHFNLQEEKPPHY